MRSVVTGVGHHLPERVVTSAEVEQLVAERSGFTLPPGIVQLLTGVRQRRWAGEDEASSDYAAAAGRAALDWDVRGMGDLRGKLAGLTLGDAGAAFVVEASDEPDGPDELPGHARARGIRQGEFMTGGDHWELSTLLAGGNLVRHGDSGKYFHCRSDDLAKLAIRHLPDLFTKTRARVGWEHEDIALVVPHQVSRAVVVDLARLWDYPLSRCMVTVDRFGNTAAASVPLAASIAVQEGRLTAGHKVVIVAGAAGFSAGVLPVVW
jgi:3-oxoacyl-[acyl-carrier-protein] synthase-3